MYDTVYIQVCICVKYSIWSSCMYILPISVWRNLKMCIKRERGREAALM